MPLKTKEEKVNALKWLWQQAKMYAVSVIAGLGTVWGVASIYLEDYVDHRIEYHKEKDKKSNKPLREIIGEQNNVPLEIVPYYVSGQLVKVDSMESNMQDFKEDYLPFIERQMIITPMYRFLDETGIEWWMGPDRHPHGVMYDDQGRAWVAYHGEKRYI